LIAVHTADERDTLAGLHTLRNHCRYMPVLPRGRLHALKIEQVLLAGLEIIDVERADDLFSVNQVSRINRSSRCRGRLRIRWTRVGRERGRCADSSDQEIAPIKTIPLLIVRHCGNPLMLRCAAVLSLP